jgi:hypothetical protein
MPSFHLQTNPIREVPTNTLVQKGPNNQATLVHEEPRSLHGHKLPRHITKDQSQLQIEQMWLREKLARLKLELLYGLRIFAFFLFQTSTS